MKQRAAFTLVEILIVLGIVGIAAGVSVTAYRSYQTNSDLSMATQLVNQGINRAKLLSMTGSKDSSWGYDVTTGTVFKGTAYNTRDPLSDEVYALPPTITPSGLLSFSFSQIYGQPDTEGTIVLTGQNGAQSTVAVTATGAPPVNQGDLMVICHKNTDGTTQTISIAVTQWPSASAAGDVRGACSTPQNEASSASSAASEQSSSSQGSDGGNVTPLPFSQKPGFLLLEPTATALSISGNGKVKVNNGGTITVNSTNYAAIKLTNNAILTCNTINVVGSSPSSTLGGTSVLDNARIVGTVHRGVTPTSDPLSTLPPPAKGTEQASISKSGNLSTTIDPGTYTSISVSGNATVKLNPGVYYLTNGLSLSGNGNVTGNEVMIYTPSGVMDLSGNGTIALSPPTSGTYKGITVYQSRSATATTFSVGGNGTVTISGILYAPKANFAISGNGTNIVGSLIIGNKATVSGNGTFIAQ